MNHSTNNGCGSSQYLVPLKLAALAVLVLAFSGVLTGCTSAPRPAGMRIVVTKELDQLGGTLVVRGISFPQGPVKIGLNNIPGRTAPIERRAVADANGDFRWSENFRCQTTDPADAGVNVSVIARHEGTGHFDAANITARGIWACPP
jgi:hypothetical protein